MKHILLLPIFTYTQVITTITGSGVEGFSSDGGMDKAEQVKGVTHFNIDTDSSIYLSDVYKRRIRKGNTKGEINIIAGTSNFGFFGDGVNPRKVAIYRIYLLIEKVNSIITTLFFGFKTYSFIALCNCLHIQVGKK